MQLNRLAAAILTVSACLFAPGAMAEPLDINTATAEQLADVLVGVGKAKAEAIVQDRQKNGEFKSIEDLARVKGIGPAIIEKNRDKITVGKAAQVPSSGSPAPTTAPAKPEPSAAAKSK
ncbi:ComEA family DNA-binding protein [Candidatus Methylocalor cossyra]|uniref:ComE operon protein 1 n=1 Tax=Candidatus Methylocalor cossyra TaxID=3108543 RepID=A0ABP1CBZ0_9GAMM